MNTKELLEKIARYKSAMEAETDADTKKKFQSRIDQLEKDIAQVEASVEKQEEKLEKQEDKAIEEAEKKLQRYKDAMDSETDPDTKAKFKKRIDDIEKQLKGVKEQIKEEKKEIEEQKKDIKDAVQDVQSAQKTVRTQAIKKAGQQVTARKTTTTKKKTRKKAIANIITKLDKLIDKNPALKAKYKNARGGSYMQYAKVDLKRDAGRASKPFGYRFKGDNTKVPRPDQRGQSNVYYENRANRADVYPKRKIKLEDGGEMMADGGEAVDLMTNTFINLFKSRGFKEKRGSMGLMFFEHKPTGVFITFDPKGYQTPVIITTDKSGENTIYEGNSIREVMKSLDRLGITDKMADGGMAGHGEMKKGGSVEEKYEVELFFKGLSGENRKIGKYVVSQNTLDNLEDEWSHILSIDVIDESEKGSISWYNLKKEIYAKGKEKGLFADGGMAGHGKRMSTGGVVLNIYESGADWKMNMAKQKDFDDYKSARKAGEKSGAFQFEIVDEITGDVIYSTHSEKMTPSLAYKDGGMANGKHYVGRFTEAQLKNKEDKKAIEKAQKETGLKYIDTKMVKKAGKIVAMDVYLIDEETYLKQPLMADGGKTEDDWEVLQVRPRKKKAKTQGYDDRKDESLGMTRGKTASKDLDGTKEQKEKSRRDDAGFETRKRGRKAHKYSWKPEAKGKVPSGALKKAPSKYYANKFPDLVTLEKQ